MKMIRYGFTCIELMVVIVTIGFLAAIVVPGFAGANTNANIAAASNDILAMTKALERHHSVNGYWPAETGVGVSPPEVSARFKGQSPFTKPCPIGSVYDYDHTIGDDGKRIISISIKSALDSPAPSIVDAQALDAYFDDGVLNTGRFRSVPDGYSYRVSE